MRILFVGNKSDLYSRLAPILRSKGHYVELTGTNTKVHPAIEKPRKGWLSTTRYLYRLTKILPEMAGFDVVQLDSPLFFQLEPGRLVYFVKELAKNNRALFLTASPDWFYVNACTKKNLFRFSPFRVGKEKTSLAKCLPQREFDLLSSRLHDYECFLFSRIKGIMALSPELEIALQPEVPTLLSTAPYPVIATPSSLSSGKIQLILPGSANNDLEQGRDFLRTCARELSEQFPEKCEISTSSPAEMRRNPKTALNPGIFLDTVYRYSPSPDALDAIGLGYVAVSGNEPEYEIFIGEKAPIIGATPTDKEKIRNSLTHLICNPAELIQQAHQGIDFIQRNHSPETVVEKFITQWQA